MSARPKHHGRYYGLSAEEIIEGYMAKIENKAFEAVKFPKEEKRDYDLRDVLKMMEDM
ncbi:hypothetical protein JW968_06555 [Candidatus Woesearchaeota archaeon]|nr:hypothetical protein [Candidatus Woesearchaeota archaeon]